MFVVSLHNNRNSKKVVHDCKPNTPGAEAGEWSQVQGHPALHSVTLSQTKQESREKPLQQTKQNKNMANILYIIHLPLLCTEKENYMGVNSSLRETFWLEG